MANCNNCEYISLICLIANINNKTEKTCARKQESNNLNIKEESKTTLFKFLKKSRSVISGFLLLLNFENNILTS